jgi:hypothetical protein
MLHFIIRILFCELSQKTTSVQFSLCLSVSLSLSLSLSLSVCVCVCVCVYRVK